MKAPVSPEGIKAREGIIWDLILNISNSFRKDAGVEVGGGWICKLQAKGGT